MAAVFLTGRALKQTRSNSSKNFARQGELFILGANTKLAKGGLFRFKGDDFMPISPFSIQETYDLIGIASQIKSPATYLVDRFFGEKMPVSYSAFVSIETYKRGRHLAPYIVKGAKGVDINRGGSKIYTYKAPMVGVRRTIGLQEIELRMIGEQPIFSNVKPEERAARMLANDLVELQGMIYNRMNQQAAQILQTGRVTLKGYADDGITVEEDEIAFDWNGAVTPTVKWNQADADIYGDLRAASDRIQEDSGTIPTLMLCGKNVEQYLLNNTALYKWLSIPNRENLSMMNFAPRYTSPQARFIGYLNALNLEIVSYMEQYTDDDGQIKPFINPDTVIIGNPGLGRQLFGAITLMDRAGQWNSYAAEIVPWHNFNQDAQQSSLSMFSRFLLVPRELSSWICLTVK